MQKFIRDVLKEKVWSKATLLCLVVIDFFFMRCFVMFAWSNWSSQVQEVKFSDRLVSSPAIVCLP